MLATSSFLAGPSIPSSPSALQSDYPAKPLQLTSTGRFQAFHPFCWLSKMSAWYFFSICSCSSSILSSQGTVSSIRTTCLVPLDQRTILGLVWVISSGNLSYFLRSARISQSLAFAPRLCCCNLPCLEKGPLESCFGFFLACSTPAVNCVRIWLCRHRNVPSTRLDDTSGQLQVGWPSAEPTAGALCQPLCVEVWVARTSYTQYSRKLIQCPSMLLMSCQVNALSRTLSHLALLVHGYSLDTSPFPSALLTSLCTMPCLSFGLALSQLALVEQPRPNLPWASDLRMSAWCRRSSYLINKQWPEQSGKHPMLVSPGLILTG